MITLMSCTDATQAKWGSLNDPHKIEVIGCDSIIRTYYSTGKVISEQNSDGYFFMDATSKQLIEISGNVIITRQ